MVIPTTATAQGRSLGGRREINWDGGGSTTASPAGTPFAGFQNTRGGLFTTPGTDFLQTPLDAPEFLSINPTHGATFQFFSPARIFTLWAVTSLMPPSPSPVSSIPAFVTGFGVRYFRCGPCG
ncbi:MAG: hypothetical protein WKF84_25110 [Pyrinomonadaceae bacterium]